MARHVLKITKTGDSCRVNNRRLDVEMDDTVGWCGTNTVGCVAFDQEDWPFRESYQRIEVPQANEPAQYFTVRSRDCGGPETNYYDYDCEACGISKAGDVEEFDLGGARIIIR